MKKLLTYIVALCLPALIIAQNPGEIRGKIFDAQSKEKLPGTTVYVDVFGKKIAAVSDTSGQFILKPLSPGSYNVFFTFIGYDTIEITSVTVYPDKITFIEDVHLTAGIYLGGFEKKEYKEKLIDPEKPSKQDLNHGQITGVSDGRTLAGALRTFFTDIYVSDDGDEIYFRGSRDGDAVYFVDGVRLRDSELHIPGLAIGSMTVYTGGVPAKYGDFTGGVVVIETQSYFSWLNDKKAKENNKNIF